MKWYINCLAGVSQTYTSLQFHCKIKLSYCLYVNRLHCCYKEAWVTTFAIRIYNKNSILIKLCCYLVTIVTTKLAWPRVIHEELIDINFVDFRKGLVTAFLGIIKNVKIHRFPIYRKKWKLHFYAGNKSFLALFHYLMVENHRKCVVYYLIFI